MKVNTLNKNERLNSKIWIDKMFAGGSSSFSVYPLRVVYLPLQLTRAAPACILISVPKKKFKHAVDRNRVKRQVREAYRKNKHPLLDVLKSKNMQLGIAFIYQSSQLTTSVEIEQKITSLLARIIDNIG